ncbi:deoxyribonucleotide triphosphate pyrophosphatase [Nodularia spumigena CS-584]|nr:deoxyribonucleotide triphosphate pyrophosphatase [Nodularia spumigena]MDB9384427.1 deoxyribonucleotide triphosphate pyrophosphatase [Nodularia spumigena CS-584]MEA5523460.1 deoxyribonucleotide triphosphate pyrophosphatase [Nodularia spumigena UHCC 0143]MEA5557842.1 deoxyribonucleotide triphosphate pyrophosphatase [Nodularia spumigena CH309]MEA5607361.1 deoxyribonucleotide triphosphate pyrophosphatase [Nodularia spumigena UHCC 0060]MEA5611167.1 deoxyribonucleotide triphosphate pyrophosphatas
MALAIGKLMKPLGNVALALLFGTISVTALNPTKVIAQETEMPSPPESVNQQIDIQEVDIQIENKIEIELEPEQSIINTPEPSEQNSSD